MRTFTVFCMDSSRTGTTYIGSDEGSTWQEAALKVRATCAEEWSASPDEIEVIGVAAGEVNIIVWDDEASVIDA